MYCLLVCMGQRCATRSYFVSCPSIWSTVSDTMLSEINVQAKWTGEWLNLMAFLGTADSKVHIVHISHVIIAYTLESLSSLTAHLVQRALNTLDTQKYGCHFNYIFWVLVGIGSKIFTIKHAQWIYCKWCLLLKSSLDDCDIT